MHAGNAVAASPAGLADEVKNKPTNPARTLGAAFVLAIVSLIATSAAHAEPFAYVAVFNHDNVSVIDTASNTVTTTVAGGVNPVGVAITPDGAFAYVTNVSSGNVSVIDTASNTVITTVTVGLNPVGVAITPDGAYAYVANGGPGNVSVIDTASNTVTATVTVGRTPARVAITPDGAFAYVTNSQSGNVSVIDTASNTVTTTVTVGSFPAGVAITPDGAFAYVTHSGDNISVIDTASNTVTTTLAAVPGAFGVAITPDGAFAYVTSLNFGNVSVIDTVSNTVTTTVPVGRNFALADVAITPDPAADPRALLQQLRDDATGKGPGTSLADKIALAQTYYAVPDIQATCAVLDAFINQVNVLLRVKKPRGATAQLITDANAIKTAIGCL